MRVLYVLLCLSCLAAVSYLGASQLVSADPLLKVDNFLSALRGGRVPEALALFGDKGCNCPPKGGYASYLSYGSGQEPNLSFLIGQQFESLKPKTSRCNDNDPYILPWERPEAIFVDIPLQFDPSRYSPYFLPLPMAFGQPMTADQFQDFLSNPGKSFSKAFSLRLRPTVRPGLVKPEKPSPQGPATTDKSQKEMAELLGPEAMKYLIPKDAGSVTLPSGSKMTVAELESKLPRLKSTILRLKVVRPGQLKAWRIARFHYMSPVLLIDKYKTLELMDSKSGGRSS